MSGRERIRKADDGLALNTLALFALPALPITMMHIPVGAVVPGFYAQHTAVTLAQIGGVFLVSRIFDAIIDPIIGHLSDHTRSPLGKRKPWVIAGTLIAVIAVWSLFNPPPHAGALYLLAWSMTLYLGWTVLEIPYRTWSAELSRDYVERSRISTWVAMMGALGTLMFMSVPLLPMFASSEIGPATLSAMALVIVLLLPACIALAVAFVPAARGAASRSASVYAVVRALGRNRPFLVFSAAFVFGGLGTGVFTAVFFVFVSSYLQIGDKFALLYVVCAGANLAAIPLWHLVTKRVGKHRALALSFAATGLVQLSMLLPAPGPGAFVPMLVIAIAYGVAEAATKVAPYALLGDVVDYDALRTGADKGGSYFALVTLVAKLNFALGGGLAFLFIGLAGYDVHGANTPATVTAFLAVFIGVPTLLWLLAALVSLAYPISAARQTIIRRRLDQRAARAV